MAENNDNVVPFTGITTLNVDPAQVMREAAKVEFSHILILGFTKDGEEFMSCSNPDGSMALWLAERMKHKLMRITDEMLESD